MKAEELEANCIKLVTTAAQPRRERRNWSRDYYSSFSADLSSFGLRYVPGQWTDAYEGTGLLVFGTLEKALQWLCLAGNWNLQLAYTRIWRARGEGRIRLPRYRLGGLVGIAQFADILKIWTSDKKPGIFPTSPVEGWPKGTQAYRHVMLLSKVPKTEIAAEYQRLKKG